MATLEWSRDEEARLAAIRDDLAQVSTATAFHMLLQLGWRNTYMQGVLPLQSLGLGKRLVGRARTIGLDRAGDGHIKLIGRVRVLCGVHRVLLSALASAVYAWRSSGLRPLCHDPELGRGRGGKRRRGGSRPSTSTGP